VFKGGTSLSKAFGIIRRFSEDIDLSFDRADLGYTGDRDPEQEGLSRKKAGQLIDDLVADVEKHIAEKLLPTLRAAIIEQLGEPKNGEWSLSIDADDPQTLNFHYPPARLRQNMLVEINPPGVGKNLNRQGVLAKDDHGHRWLLHQGRAFTRVGCA
jgi:hypothetical protein